MNKIIYYVSITLLTVVSSCGNKETNVSRKLTLDNCPVIAQVINLQGDPVTNLDFSSVKDTFNLPLSSLLSSFQVIRLENSEDALTAMKEMINPDSLNVLPCCYIEKYAAGMQPLSYLQFQRIGYFNVDKDSTPEKMVFNRTVGLKDVWGKINK